MQLVMLLLDISSGITSDGNDDPLQEASFPTSIKQRIRSTKMIWLISCYTYINNVFDGG